MAIMLFAVYLPRLDGLIWVNSKIILRGAFLIKDSISFSDGRSLFAVNSGSALFFIK